MVNLDWMETEITNAVSEFWRIRGSAKGGVRGGGHLRAFEELIRRTIEAAGLKEAQVFTGQGVAVLPGYFRPSKNWDVVVTHRKQLIAAVELKSMASSFGKNLNNRVEEALGSAVDLGRAIKHAKWKTPYKPFLGYIMLLHDIEDTRKEDGNRIPKTVPITGLEVPKEFINKHYQQRYVELCKRMVEEEIYTHAALVCSVMEGSTCIEPDEAYGLRRFIQRLAGHAYGERPLS